MPAFHENLRRLRAEAGLTQPQLADKLGVSKSAVSMYERGEREPDIATLRRIAAVFSVDMNLLLGDGPAPGPQTGGAGEDGPAALGAAYFALAREMQSGGIHPDDVREMLKILRRVQGGDE